MRHLRLPDHLGVCEIDGRVIMLDLRGDRYFKLDPLSAAAMRRWRNRDDGPDHPDLARLVELGMLVPALSPMPPCRTLPAVPLQSLPRPAAGAGAALPILLEVGAGLSRVRRRLRRNGLEAAVGEVRHRSGDRTGPDLLAELARFRAARQLVPLAPNCLLDALALSAFLSRRQIRPDLVFGVKLDPFAAHCWLQNDAWVLTDGPDSVAAFTPILVV